ncbi:MAG: L,D-transpeptidase family protein [Desulfuromonadaceae bacterium]
MWRLKFYFFSQLFCLAAILILGRPLGAWTHSQRDEGPRNQGELSGTASTVEASRPVFIFGQDAILLLTRELQRYRALAAAGGWPEIPAGMLLKRGIRHGDVPVLRRRLAVAEAAPGDRNDSDLFDEELERAGMDFQARHGLQTDGVVGPLTRMALNVPPGERVNQILVNLERLSWISENLGERYIYVNIAAFTLDVIEHRKKTLSMKVVVGKPYWNTPVFSAPMTYLIINPSWNIPESIIAEEILPRLQETPDYLAKQNIRVLSGGRENPTEVDPATVNWRHMITPLEYRFRQEPGPLNPMGRIKFMFPNRYNVYLHDTPAKDLFKKWVRAFSHGCIRIEKPLELAQYLLQDSPPSIRAKAEKALVSGELTVVDLARPIKVHIVYLTAWPDDTGRVQFRGDIYGRDASLLETLRQKALVSGSEVPTGTHVTLSQ